MTELGLPAHIRACLFDLDGVITSTATLHTAAWRETFDAFLRRRDGAGFRPFDPVGDYAAYVDGRPRADGVRTFLASRGIELPEGEPDDPPERATVHGLGNAKNALLLRKIEQEGVETYPGSVRYVDAVRAAGLRTAVVSASANCAAVLRSVGMTDRFDVRIDGVVAEERALPGKPHPDTFLAAAQDLGVSPHEAAVFEDALAGMDAARTGGFGYAIGVDRIGQADALREHGADTVVRDLAGLLDGRAEGT
ncbi:HAD family hydrolase [Streptomyces indicus]|uniref:Beta-phosphoglucomutase n=1 Tax=Streptomyces indicus TaxID=417292 RepID=A0A1G8UV76_9ACTN|nr:beta-phosphoglucomutase family hydrolase [Streptomyces indicus]SDJ57554.1 haloacid dehalogenase superfamily, subfamily IA, variant 3 with third motif having DD or ED/beta-phosphoglucomutase family hydrolase [Streptomyces indicus]